MSCALIQPSQISVHVVGITKLTACEYDPYRVCTTADFLEVPTNKRICCNDMVSFQTALRAVIAAPLWTPP